MTMYDWLKDFAMESDESHIYNSAHLMVASLVGSLAHVTCKEPLRISISNHLRNSLHSLNVVNDLLEHAVQIVINDNLDLGCAADEEASGKAEQAIDGEIAGQPTIRRKHREGVGATYFDASTYTQGPLGVVPESLRPKPGRLSLSQHRVYEAEQAIDGEITGQPAIRRKHREGVGATYFDASTYTQGPLGVVPESLRPKPGRLSLSQHRVYEDFGRFLWQNHQARVQMLCLLVHLLLLVSLSVLDCLVPMARPLVSSIQASIYLHKWVQDSVQGHIH
ncbi:hypothetical protein AQUCO_10300010v1 [Aquilegia coerulea]|uniref:CCR4-NOT transcription complex subunit 1 domain-containing protein n=1 Tax=Aquilegia coerulea TaxID=218851 RepID=A0A2G5C3Q6_AQUCA|nr:hypothetical protein AQUCO_10300010v1 [Aquilegia coerulea]